MRLGAAAVVLMAILSCTSGGSRSADTRPRVATVIALTGACEVLRGTGSEWSKLQKGAELFEDDRLRTFKSASLQLAFIGGSSLKVDEESLISVGGSIVVERGAVEGELQPGLSLRTPSLEAETVRARDIVIQ
jgi:hypothetical protein